MTETEKEFNMNIVQEDLDGGTHIVFPFVGVGKVVFIMKMFTVKMIMLDELGSEVVIDTFSISSELDSDYLEVWEEMKIAKAKERYPEAMGFYFEDSRDLDSMVDDDVYTEINGLKDARDLDVEYCCD